MRANFDLIASFYPILERLVFKAKLDEARRSFFDVVLEANRVLLVGEGNGRFLKSLIARKLNGYIKVVEQSGLMISPRETYSHKILGCPSKTTNRPNSHF